MEAAKDLAQRAKEVVKPTDGEKPTDTKEKASKKAQAADKPLPDFIVKRNELFDRLKKEYSEKLKAKAESGEALNITLQLSGGEELTCPATAWGTTPGHLLKNVPKEVSASVVIAKVNGELWDLDRPFEFSCKVQYIPFESKEGREVFWHSSAHVLGEACECEYGALLSHGPPTAQGFFYDMAMAEG